MRIVIRAQHLVRLPQHFRKGKKEDVWSKEFSGNIIIEAERLRWKMLRLLTHLLSVNL